MLCKSPQTFFSHPNSRALEATLYSISFALKSLCLHLWMSFNNHLSALFQHPVITLHFLPLSEALFTHGVKFHESGLLYMYKNTPNSRWCGIKSSSFQSNQKTREGLFRSFTTSNSFAGALTDTEASFYVTFLSTYDIKPTSSSNNCHSTQIQCKSTIKAINLYRL